MQGLFYELDKGNLQIGETDLHHGQKTEDLLLDYFRTKWPKDAEKAAKYYKESKARTQRSHRAKLRTGFERRHAKKRKKRQVLPSISRSEETDCHTDKQELYDDPPAHDRPVAKKGKRAKVKKSQMKESKEAMGQKEAKEAKEPRAPFLFEIETSDESPFSFPPTFGLALEPLPLEMELDSRDMGSLLDDCLLEQDPHWAESHSLERP